LNGRLPNSYRNTILKRLTGISYEAVDLIGFLAVLWVGRWITSHVWPSENFVIEAQGHKLTIRVTSVFDIGDITLITVFIVRAAMRMFGKMKEE
jgi:hypothetical protein